MIQSAVDLLVVWLIYEVAASLVGHPIDAQTKEPVRPPLSVGDMLWYNPGYLRGGYK